MSSFISETADIDPGVHIGSGSYVWHLAQVRTEAVIGSNCTVGRGAYIGSGVSIGNRCKIQNYALVYEPARIDDDVFIGPGVILTNDKYPRASSPDGKLKTREDWHQVGVTVHRGASIGARSVCVAPVTIGAWSVVGAGSVVVRDVPSHALVLGTPARQVGWVDFQGHRLQQTGGNSRMWTCEIDGSEFELTEDLLTPISRNENPR